MKKILILLLVLVVAGAAFAGGGKEAAAKEGTTAPARDEAPKATAAARVIKNPDTFIYASYGTVDSLDPAKAYDEVSGGIILNVYDTLVDFKGGSTEEFVPLLAEEVPTIANGGISQDGKTYRFKIRQGVTFHSGNALTPEGVAYSFKRHMVVDADGGPMWMAYEPLLGTYSSRDDDGHIAVTLEQLNQVIQVDGDSVVFKLLNAYAPFLSIMTQYCTAVIDKDFAIANGDWKGTQADIARVNGPEEGQEPLYEVASGTGPFKLARWDKGVETVLERNDSYWGKKPPMRRAIYRVVEEWSTRKLLLMQGDIDVATVDPMYYEEMRKESGLKIVKGVELGNRGINFNMAINAIDNPYIFSGKLDGQGVPPDFFADKDVRMGFIYAFDLETYLVDINANSGIPAATPICSGLPFYNENLKHFPFDLKKAEEHFKKAWGGQLWARGFKVDLLFNSGNEVRENTLKMIAQNIMSLNPRFQITVRGVEWATYLDLQRQRRMPTYYIGWGADFPDPHNFVQPYMHSQGLFGGRCGYKNAEVDQLVEKGAIETDAAKRKQIYHRLQQIWLEDNIGIMLHQPIRENHFRDWVKGYTFHPMETHPWKYVQFDKGY